MHKFLFALCLLVPLGAHSETIDPRMAKYDICGIYAVLHINGVDTDRPGGERNLAELKLHYGNAHKSQLVRYGLGYNNTITQAMDIEDAMYRTITEFPGITFSDWVNAFYNGIFPSWFPQSLMATITTRLAANFNIVNRPDSYYESDVVYIAADAQRLNFLNIGSRLLIVGHSEGSIIANTMYRRFTSAMTTPYRMEPRQVGLMSIAAFVGWIEGTGSEYVTNVNDRPVQMGRLAYSAIKPGTVTIPHTEDFYNPWRGHNLINKYLADTTSRDQIVSKMKAVLDGLRVGNASPGPYWAPPYNGIDLVVYASVDWATIPNAVPPIPDWYQWWSPGNAIDPFSSFFTRVNGTLAQATAQALVNGEQCYNLHIAETLHKRALRNSSWTKIYGCWDMASQPTGSWWPYSGTGTPAFRTSYDPRLGRIVVTAGATCQI
jgi:hypothetical protein